MSRSRIPTIVREVATPQFEPALIYPLAAVGTAQCAHIDSRSERYNRRYVQKEPKVEHSSDQSYEEAYVQK